MRFSLQTLYTGKDISARILYSFTGKVLSMYSVSPCAAKLKGIDSRIHVSHLKEENPLEWFSTLVSNFMLHLTRKRRH